MWFHKKYKINCSDCHASYIGETSRNLATRLTEHKRATRKGDVNNYIAEHHRLTNHTIDWDSAQCLQYQLISTTKKLCILTNLIAASRNHRYTAKGRFFFKFRGKINIDSSLKSWCKIISLHEEISIFSYS